MKVSNNFKGVLTIKSSSSAVKNVSITGGETHTFKDSEYAFYKTSVDMFKKMGMLVLLPAGKKEVKAAPKPVETKPVVKPVEVKAEVEPTEVAPEETETEEKPVEVKEETKPVVKKTTRKKVTRKKASRKK